MPQDGDQQPVGIFGINDDRADLLSVAQAQMAPRATSIRRFIQAVANGEIRPPQSLAASHVNDVGIGRRDGQRSDRLRLPVENRLPGIGAVVRLPHAAVVDSDIKHARLLWNARSSYGSASAEGPDHAPMEVAIERRHILCGSEPGAKSRYGAKAKKSCHDDQPPNLWNRTL